MTKTAPPFSLVSGNSPEPRHVAVLLGGWSAERDVSLVSGTAVCNALKQLGHKVTEIDVKRDAAALIHALSGTNRPDIVFNALHGQGGEDGVIQGLLEMLHLPYTHSGVAASAVCMNKPLTKNIVSSVGVQCAEGVTLSRAHILEHGIPLEAPYIIKPTHDGSSVGVRIINEGDNLCIVEEEHWVYGEQALIEKYIPGRELTVALLGDEKSVHALAVTELRTTEAFYDYTAKYTDGKTQHLLPAPLPPEIYDACLAIGEKCYKALGCNGAARIDIRWDDTMKGTTGLFFLELNTQPGLTPLSLLPEQAAYTGMPFNDLISWMLEHPTCPA